jgi:hypothetical protein
MMECTFSTPKENASDKFCYPKFVPTFALVVPNETNFSCAAVLRFTVSMSVLAEHISANAKKSYFRGDGGHQKF